LYTKGKTSLSISPHSLLGVTIGFGFLPKIDTHLSPVFW
jgi:hypothetical protein